MGDEQAQAVLTKHQARWGRWGLLVPEFTFRPGNQWNSNHWGFNWLCFHLWSADVPHLGASIQLDHQFRLQLHLPYLHAAAIVPVFRPDYWYGKLARAPTQGKSL